MKVSSMSENADKKVAELSLKCVEQLYKDIFTLAEKEGKISLVNNSILVHLGLIKVNSSKKIICLIININIMLQSEDKTFKIRWNVSGCLNGIKTILAQNFIPESTKDTLRVFLQR